MFRDLKEYQQIQKIYEERVCISEEERYITKELEETFTEDEITFIAENTEEVFTEIGNQLAEEGFEITEENIDEMAKAISKVAVPLAQRMATAASKLGGKTGVAKKITGGVAKKTASGGGGLMQKAGGLVKKVGGFIKKNVGKIATAVGAGAAGAGVATAVNKSKPKVETDASGKVIPSTASIRAKSDRVGGGNAGASTDAGLASTANMPKATPVSAEPKKPVVSTTTKQGKPRTKAQMMAAKRIAAGKSISDVKQSSRDAMKARAAERFAAFKAKRAEKKSAMEEYTPYDIVLEYLLSSEQVATIEEANYVMTEMDAETIQGIVEEQKKIFDEGLASMALKTGLAIAGGVLAKKGLDKAKKSFDNYIDKERDKPGGGNTRPGADQIYFGDKKKK